MHYKKRLGQHFLKNKNMLEKIAAAAELTKKDTVLEVGPGHGELTELLAKKAGKVVAVEKDPELVEFLIPKFREYRNVEIIQGDILKIFNYQLLIFKKFENLKIENSLKIENYKLKIVANLPYYITSRFLRLFLSETKFRTTLMVLMVQKEVAERIMAKNGKESLLSLSVKAYAEPEIILKKVPAAYFSPPPEVDSAVIKLTVGKHSVFAKNKIDEKKFWQIARVAFQQKRKMLRHSIGKKSKLPEKYAAKRPEELSLKDWIELSANPRIRKFR